MQERAYAKINLALHVRSRAPDGYHDIETVFAFAEDGDLLEVAAADELTLDITGTFASALGSPSDNLALRAASALRDRFGVTQGAALTLEKRLPVAAGIGGGSADAAAAIRLLVRHWGIDAADADLLDLAASLGADVPACLLSNVARGSGRGDVLALEDGSGLAGTPLLLVNPAVPLSTAEVFAAWDGVDRGALPTASPLAVAAEGRNDLEAPAIRLVPEIADVLAELGRAEGAFVHRMSGSGATCFALFEDIEPRDATARVITDRHPGWWLLPTRLR